MRQTWKKFGMATALASADDMARDQLKENLKGWFFEYLDEGLIDEFFEDLMELAKEELKYFEQKKCNYEEAIKRLSKE